MFDYVEGEDRQFEERGTSLLEEYDERDLYLSVNRGGAGLGDPIERDPESIEEDLNEEHVQQEYAERVYGAHVTEVGDGDYEVDPEKTASKRERIRKQRGEEAVPADEWMEQRREDVVEGDFIPVVKKTYNESLELSEEWDDHFRSFWDLPEDFTFDMEE